MKSLALLFALAALPVTAAVNMKPGLWRIDTVVVRDGKETDPTAHMKAALAKMSPEQRKHVEEMMGKMGGAHGAPPVGLGKDGGVQVCYTPAMLANPQGMANQHAPSGCKSRVIEHSALKLSVEFQCEDGSKGKGAWSTTSDTFEGKMELDSPKSGKSVVRNKGKFLSADCGKLKPKA